MRVVSRRQLVGAGPDIARRAALQNWRWEQSFYQPWDLSPPMSMNDILQVGPGPRQRYPGTATGAGATTRPLRLPRCRRWGLTSPQSEMTQRTADTGFVVADNCVGIKLGDFPPHQLGRRRDNDLYGFGQRVNRYTSNRDTRPGRRQNRPAVVFPLFPYWALART